MDLGMDLSEKKIHKMKPTDYISKGTFYSEGVGEIWNRHSN